jgi:peptidoglycan/LPS O-acetylase OafA/YrhL
MHKGISLYLDLLRFVMALEVVIGHSTFHGYTGHGFLWQVDPFNHLQTAVVAFFVLSGFVIAYASHTKENVFFHYACSRVARMHSIIIPALLITLLFDTIGTALNPAFYNTWDFPTPIADGQFLRYFLSFIYLNNTWLMPHMNPGTNGPFWTMTYEVLFYAIFGVIYYCKGKYRLLFALPLIFIAGKSVLLMFPLWLLGVGTYHLHLKIRLSKYLAILTFLTSFVVLLVCSNLRPGTEIQFTGRATHLDYAEGLLLAINIFAAASMSPLLLSILGKHERLVRWLGMLTFSLYLCHRPLLNFFSAVVVSDPDSYIQKIWLFGATFCIVIVIAYIGEWLRLKIKRFLLLSMGDGISQVAIRV